MYIVFVLDAAMPLGRFTQTRVFDAVFTALFSIQACSVLPVAAGPVVNSTLLHCEFM